MLVVGAGFKRGQSLTTGSPGVELMKMLLQSWEAHVEFADPLVEEAVIPFVPRLDEKTEWNKEGLERFDLIIVAVRQEELDFGVLEELEGDVQVEMWN